MKTNESQTFRTVVKDVNKCPINSTIIYRKSMEEKPVFNFLSVGAVKILDQEYFLQAEYCVSRFSQSSIEIKYCEVKCGETHKCIQKCCPPGEVVDFNSTDGTSKCSNSGSIVWKPIVYDEYSGCGSLSQNDGNFHFIVADIHPGHTIPYKHIEITHENSRTREEGYRFRLMSDGHIMSQDGYGKWMEIKNHEFCIDGMTGSVGSEVYSGKLDDQLYYSILWARESYNSTNETDEIWDCDAEYATSYAKQITIITLSIIGAFFLLLTATLYLLIWEKHNIHGWTIFSFVITMFFMFLFVGLSHMISMLATSDLSATAGCRIVGVLTHFFYLTTMCWLTIINVDLWLTFRNVKPTGGPAKSINQYILYLLFAIGIPMLIVGFAIIVDCIYSGGFGDGSECEPPLVLPLYGVHQCYIQHYAETLYLHISMAILLSCNILTFSSTLFTLCVYRNQTRNAISGSTSHQKESLILFSKLFVVTGVSWILEVLSTLFEEPQWLWVIFDSYNLLQAVLIFILFAMKRENLVFLHSKYPGLRFLLRPSMRTTCCYIETANSEQTEVSGVAMDRNSKIHFRRGSNQSTAAVASSGSSGSAVADKYN